MWLRVETLEKGTRAKISQGVGWDGGMKYCLEGKYGGMAMGREG